MFQPVQSGILCIGRGQSAPERYGKGGKNARNGRVHARQQGRVPQQACQNQIWPQCVYLEPVQRQHGEPKHKRCQQRRQVQLGGIEKRDDGHRTHVIDDRNRRQKQFQRGRCPTTQKGKDADGKSNICRRRYCPSPHKLRVASGKAEIDHRRDDHSGRSRDDRQAAVCPGCQVTVDKFTLNFQTDKQEEYGHQSIINPQMDRHRAEFRRQFRANNGMNKMEIIRGKCRVGGDQRERRRNHQ